MHSFKKLLLTTGLLVLGACTTVPITGRRQLDLVSDSQLIPMATQQYQQVLAENKVITGTASATMVKRVGGRIQQAVEQYFRQQGKSQQLAGYQWEFTLLQDPQVNAWCMPGGKVAVYSGILPITRDENGLAVVLGHEIAHAVARHVNERMSNQQLAQVGGAVVSSALGGTGASSSGLLLRQAVGIGTQVGLLRFSRQQESEADHLGLIFMAMAGYDPRGAVEFWQRMAALSQSQGNSTPAFLSDHPADADRIAAIKQELPQALQYYKGR